MPRTIDSLSPKQNDAKSKPVSGSAAGDVYRPAGSGPVAGSIVKPAGAKESTQEPAKSNSFQADKAVSIQRKKVARRSLRRKILKFGIPLLVILLLVGGYFYITQRTPTINGQKKDNLSDDATKKKAEDAFNTASPVASLSEEDRKALFKEVGPQYLAAYVTGLAPSQTDINRLQLSLGANATKEQIKQVIDAIIQYKLDLVKTTGYYEGSVYYFWYGNTLVNKLPEETIPGWGDATALADDKAYAEMKAKDYRAQLQAGSITDQALVTALEADNRLQLYDEANGSGPIVSTKNDLGSDDDGRQASLLAFLQKQNELGISELGTIRADPGYPSSGQQKDVGYVVVRLTTLLRGQAVIDYYNQQLLVAKGL